VPPFTFHHYIHSLCPANYVIISPLFLALRFIQVIVSHSHKIAMPCFLSVISMPVSVRRPGLTAPCCRAARGRHEPRRAPRRCRPAAIRARRGAFHGACTGARGPTPRRRQPPTAGAGRPGRPCRARPGHICSFDACGRGRGPCHRRVLRAPPCRAPLGCDQASVHLALRAPGLRRHELDVHQVYEQSAPGTCVKAEWTFHDGNLQCSLGARMAVALKNCHRPY